MADNNKFSIDIELNNDGEKQINQYAKSFDDLRSSINSLSQPFSSFANNLNTLDKNLSQYTASLNEINIKNKEFISIGNNVGNKVTGLSSSFGTWFQPMVGVITVPAI